MYGVDSLSGWGTLILMLPFLALLALSLFGLDESLATPRRRFRPRRRFCELTADGQWRLLDPDVHDPDAEEYRQDRGRDRRLSPGTREASGRPPEGENCGGWTGGGGSGPALRPAHLSITLQNYLSTSKWQAGPSLPRCGRSAKNLLT